MFGKKIEEMSPTGAGRDEEWAKLKKGFGIVDGWLQKGKADGPYFLGNELFFADFVVGGRLVWIRQILREDSSEWNDIKTWNEGTWGVYVEGLRRYENVA